MLYTFVVFSITAVVLYREKVHTMDTQGVLVTNCHGIQIESQQE